MFSSRRILLARGSPLPVASKGALAQMMRQCHRLVPDGSASLANDATSEGPSFDIFQLYGYPPHTPEAAAYLFKKLKEYNLHSMPRPYIDAWEQATKRVVETGGVWVPDDGMTFNFPSILKHKPLEHEEAKVKSILCERLGKSSDRSLAVVGRHDAYNSLCTFFQQYVRPSSLGNTYGGRDKRGLLTMFSTRGSGKTELLKRVLHAFSAPLAQGYILVCDCAKAPFADAVQTLSESERDKKAIELFLVRIIKKHVQLTFGVSLECGGEGIERETSVESAVSEWKKLCDNASGRVRPDFCMFQPLIVLDSTEALPYSSTIKRDNQSPHRTVIEAMVLALPRVHGLVAVGSLHVGTVDLWDTTHAVTRIPALSPLSLEDYLWSKCMRAYYYTVSPQFRVPSAVTTQMRLIHFLSGGVPRLIWQTTFPIYDRSPKEGWWLTLDFFACECECLTLYEEYSDNRCTRTSSGSLGTFASNVGVMSADQNAVLAMASLYSGARAKVNPQKTVPFTQSWLWSLAQKELMFIQNNGEAMVPPALFLGEALSSVSAALAAEDLATTVEDERSDFPQGAR